MLIFVDYTGSLRGIEMETLMPMFSSCLRRLSRITRTSNWESLPWEAVIPGCKQNPCPAELICGF